MEKMRSYYERHKEERRRCYQEHKEEMKAYQRKYYQEHREKRKEYQRKYRQEHKEEMKEYQRKYIKRLKESPPYRKIGDFLREALENLSKNQSWLAKQLEISREAVSKYLQGIYFPKKKVTREKLCRVFKIENKDLENLLS